MPARSLEGSAADWLCSLPGRLWIRDSDFRYLYVDPRLAGESGASAAELIGKRPEELWDGPTSAQAVEICERALAELTGGAGVRYDPDAVAACVRIVGDGFALPPAGD